MSDERRTGFCDGCTAAVPMDDMTLSDSGTYLLCPTCSLYYGAM